MDKETHKIEFKSSWRDDYLRVLCGMANTDGGVLHVGVNDDGKVVGLAGAHKLSEDSRYSFQGQLHGSMGAGDSSYRRCLPQDGDRGRF